MIGYGGNAPSRSRLPFLTSTCAMKANCDNFEQPDTYVYPANLRLLGDNGYQVILDKYLNDFMDLKQEPTPAIIKQMTTEIQQVLDQPRL